MEIGFSFTKVFHKSAKMSLAVKFRNVLFLLSFFFLKACLLFLLVNKLVWGKNFRCEFGKIVEVFARMFV